MKSILTFNDLEELRKFSNLEELVAIQTGEAGGLWFRDAESELVEDNDGTVIVAIDKSVWKRMGDPARLDARWFGVKADGVHDDAKALQKTIDALPSSGGKVLLPGGRMLCGNSLRIDKSFITLEGVNCGLQSKLCEPGHVIGMGSLLLFSRDCDGICIVGPVERTVDTPRRGGVTLRDFGVAGTGRANGYCGITAYPGGQGDGWMGSTDGLLLERLYVIDYEWSVKLKQTDASIITNCWLSECGNSIKLNGAIYTAINNCVIADNDHLGIFIKGGKGTDIFSTTFVRVEHALVAENTTRLKVIGGTCETDPAGGERNDKAFMVFRNVEQSSLNSISFSRTGPNPDVAICIEDTSDVSINNCSGVQNKGNNKDAKG